jgi:hypothetical protein
MKKLLFIAVMFGVLFASAFVIAQQGLQNIKVDVDGTAEVTITPNEIVFGNANPEDIVPLDDAITFSATTNSNQDINIVVQSITGIFGGGNLESSIADANSFDNMELLDETIQCNSPDGLLPCVYSNIILDLQLTIPPGTPAQTQRGGITYTISGEPPTGP